MPAMSSNAPCNSPPSTPTFEASGTHEQTALLLPPHASSSSSIQIHPQSVRFSSTPSNVAEYTLLSPLIQRTPNSAKGDKDIELLHRTYEGFNSDDLFLEAGPSPKSDVKGRKGVSFFQYDKETWSDPGEVLGSRTIWISILTGLSLMGVFALMGHSNNLQVVPTPTHRHATISTHFPFSPAHYLEDCQIQATDVTGSDLESEDSSSTLRLNTTIPIHIPYFSLTEAEQAVENQQPYSKTDNQGQAICAKTASYLIDNDHGLAFHLNAITLVAALAKKDGRDFFLIDGDWDRGYWSDHFAEIPAPACQPPPPAEMYGCPRSSRHWIVTSSILPYHFSDAEFQLAYGDNKATNGNTQDFLPRLIPNNKKPIFAMAREAFEMLLSPSPYNQKLIGLVTKEIVDSKLWKGGEAGKLPPFLSVHFRKGDRHPFNPDHQLDYIPVTDYLEAMNATWSNLRAKSQLKLPIYPNVYVASDTPLIMDTLTTLVPKWHLFQLSESKHKELSLMAHPHEYSQRHFNSHAKSEKVAFTRGQVIDMHFIGGGWARNSSNSIMGPSGNEHHLATICTISSNICQFAALQIGWPEAFENGKFINIDLPLTRSWEGIEIPQPGLTDEVGVHKHGQMNMRLNL